MKIFLYLIFNFIILSQTAFSQINLYFQGNETGDTWGFTTTGASASALNQANLNPNKVTGTKSIVAGGNTGGGSCYESGSGNGTMVENKITFQAVTISSSNSQIRTLTFSWGSRFPVCDGTGWDNNENLTFTPIIDGIPQTPITLATGSVNANFNIKLAAQKYSYSIPSCVNSFAFELMLPTNRRDELLFVDDVKLTTPSLNAPLTIPLVVTGDASVCRGATSSVSANSSPNVSYDWSGLPTGASFTTPNNSTTSNSMNIAWGTASSGTYQVKVKPHQTQCGIDVYGAEVSFQVVVQNDPVLTTSPASSICAGETITLNVSGATTYNWSNGLGTNNSITVSPTATTSYQVTGFNGACSSSETIVVTVNQGALFAGNDITICEGSSVTLAASGGNNYSWDQGVLDGIAFIPTATNTYTVTSTGACASSDQIIVTVEPIPTIDFSSDVTSGCSPLKVQFDNQTIGNITYQWNFGDGTTSNLENPDHTFTTSGCKNITLSATSAGGCVNTWIKDNYICVSENPSVQFTTNTNEISSQSSTVEFTNQSVGVTNYTWSFGDGNFSNEESPFYTYNPYSLENQLVTLVGTNSAGCIDSAMTIIYFASIPSMYVPNSFTPNGDEFNQVFTPKFGDGIDLTNYHLFVFNRWGGLVFETNDINIGWDGTSSGLYSQEGTYIWKMQYGILDGVDRIERSGHITLVR